METRVNLSHAIHHQWKSFITDNIANHDIHLLNALECLTLACSSQNLLYIAHSDKKQHQTSKTEEFK